MDIKAFITKKRKLSKKAVCILAALLIAFSAATFWGNVTLSKEVITLETHKLSDAFNGFKIAHISDYHNTHIQSLTDCVIDDLNAQKPDVIFLTGDVIDCRKTDIAKSIEFVRDISGIAPVYYVTGNHECNLSIEDQSAFDNMLLDFENMGVTVLRNEKAEFSIGDEKINIFGIDDPYFHCWGADEIEETTVELLEDFEVNGNEFNVLLAHHPEQLEAYSEKGFDAVYSGHAHGGQGRLFGIGLIAPDQGLFPKYTSGLYEENGTSLIVSRGIGNSIAPVRIFDRPHLIYTIIK